MQTQSLQSHQRNYQIENPQPQEQQHLVGLRIIELFLKQKKGT